MKEMLKLRKENEELRKENLFLKKQRHSLQKKSNRGLSVPFKNIRKILGSAGCCVG